MSWNPSLRQCTRVLRGGLHARVVIREQVLLRARIKQSKPRGSMAGGTVDGGSDSRRVERIRG